MLRVSTRNLLVYFLTEYMSRFVLELNAQCVICCQIEGRQWSFLTDDAKDLVSQMLEADPNRRVTIEDALKHPWIRVSNVNV